MVGNASWCKNICCSLVAFAQKIKQIYNSDYNKFTFVSITPTLFPHTSAIILIYFSKFHFKPVSFAFIAHFK